MDNVTTQLTSGGLAMLRTASNDNCGVLGEEA